MASVELSGSVKSVDSQQSLLEAERATLTERIQAIECEVSIRAAELDELHEECLGMGYEGKRSYLKARTRYQTWKSEIMREKGTLIRRLQEVNQELRSLREMRQEASLTEAYYRLKEEVRLHRQRTLDEYEPTEADTTLWDAAGVG